MFKFLSLTSAPEPLCTFEVMSESKCQWVFAGTSGRRGTYLPGLCGRPASPGTPRVHMQATELCPPMPDLGSRGEFGYLMCIQKQKEARNLEKNHSNLREMPQTDKLEKINAGVGRYDRYGSINV